MYVCTRSLPKKLICLKVCKCPQTQQQVLLPFNSPELQSHSLHLAPTDATIGRPLNLLMAKESIFEFILDAKSSRPRSGSLCFFLWKKESSGAAEDLAAPAWMWQRVAHKQPSLYRWEDPEGGDLHSDQSSTEAAQSHQWDDLSPVSASLPASTVFTA